MSAPGAWAGRRHLAAAELVAPPASRLPHWPVVSIVLLMVLGRALPAGLVSAMNGLLVFLALAQFIGGGGRADAALRRLGGVLAPLLAMALVGIAMGGQRLGGQDAYEFLRDGWYFANPMLAMAVGFVFARAMLVPAHAAAGQAANRAGNPAGHPAGHEAALDPQAAALARARGCRAFVLGGTAVAVLHLMVFVANPQLLSWEATEVRGALGGGWWAPALAVLVLLASWGHWREALALPPPAAALALGLSTASVVLSYSRVLAVIVLIGSAVACGALARHGGRRVLLGLLVAVLAIGALRVVIEPESREARTSFFGKFARMPEEMWPTDRLYGQEVHDNWRGYETARALRHWAAGHPGNWLLGDGFGALVDLGRFQQLSAARPAAGLRDSLRFIAVFHNGYIQVLVKTGLVGVALFVWMLWRLYRLGREDAGSVHPADTTRRRHGRLLQAMAVALALSTAVWTGVFVKQDLLPFLLIIGWLLAQPRGDIPDGASNAPAAVR